MPYTTYEYQVLTKSICIIYIFIRHICLTFRISEFWVQIRNQHPQKPQVQLFGIKNFPAILGTFFRILSANEGVKPVLRTYLRKRVTFE